MATTAKAMSSARMALTLSRRFASTRSRPLRRGRGEFHSRSILEPQSATACRSREPGEIGAPFEDLDHVRDPGLSAPRCDLDGAANQVFGELAGVAHPVRTPGLIFELVGTPPRERPRVRLRFRGRSRSGRIRLRSEFAVQFPSDQAAEPGAEVDIVLRAEPLG